MQLGLKNRLRLISLLPIVVLFAMTSYYVYDSFIAYKAAQQLHNRLGQNKHLNEVVGNLARERGMSAMYLGNKTENILKSLNKQREVVDTKIESYLRYAKQNKILHSHKGKVDKENCLSCKNIQNLVESIEKIKSIRDLVDEHKIDFEEMFMNTFVTTQKKLIKQLEQITENQIDKEINELYTLYISMVNAKDASGIERGYISYIISRSKSLTSDDLNKWISLISKADAINYEGIRNKALVKKLDAIFKIKDNTELFNDINYERTSLISSAKSGEYDISSAIWFTMLSEKINLIAEAENILLDAMDARAKKVQQNSLQVLIVTLSVWGVAIILAVFGYLLSNEIASNIKHLESVLKRVAQDYDSEAKKINLHTSQGTNLAYKLLEEIIEQTKKDKISAQEANKAKSMFLANMSHEIRTPLNGIVGFTELLKGSDLQEEQKEFLDIIEKSSENLLEIINNILDLSKIENNKLEIENIPFYPLTELENAVEIYAVRAGEKKINLGCFIDPRLEFPIKGDPTKLKEVIINLLSNAVKFTNTKGAVNVDIRKVQSNEAGKTRVRFTIQDNGIGITDEQKSGIFEAFSQADTSITRKYGGTGLGLTISSSFVTLMGGRLNLQSSPGEGTTFSFSLDFEEAESLLQNSKNSFFGLHALIVSDPVKTKRQDTYLREYLDYFGVRVTSLDAQNINKSLAKNQSYDLLFIDYDYIGGTSLAAYGVLAQEIIVLTKSNLIKRIDSSGIDIFKTLYEPIHATKIKQVLENYSANTDSFRKAQKSSCKEFDPNSAKFFANALVAEDNVINQKLIQKTLEDLGLNVTIANNGQEAVQKRKEENYDIIFMDIQMPLLDGVEATAEILKWEKDYNTTHIPIIALTANALKGDREKFLASGFDEYTAKPLVRSEIIALLHQFLKEKNVKKDNGTHG